MNNSRVQWIDCARGIGIIFVVIGHTVMSIWSIPIHYILFTFHMPMFVFITSRFLKDEEWKVFFHKKLKSLIVPYGVYTVLIGTIYIISQPNMPLINIVKFTARLALGGTFLFSSFGAFWYVPAIFCASTLYIFIKQMIGSENEFFFTSIMIVTYIISCIISRANISVPIPYAFHTLPALVFLLWVGRLMPWETQRNAMSIISIGILVLAYFYDRQTPGQDFHFDLKRGDIGHPFVGILIAVSGSHLIFILSSAINNVVLVSDVLRYIGRITMPVLFIHQPVHFLLLRFGVDNGLTIALLALLSAAAFAWAISTFCPQVGPYFGISPSLKSISAPKI